MLNIESAKLFDFQTNFFERRVGEYQMSGVMGGKKEKATFTTDADF